MDRDSNVSDNVPQSNSGQFQKGNQLGFTKDNQPENNGRKKNHLVNLLDKLLDEKIEITKNGEKVWITREEALIRAIIQRATAKSDMAAQQILDRRFGKVKEN